MKQRQLNYFNRNLFTATIGAVLIILISSCTPSSQNQVSILENSNCDLPCWNNIVPGKTSEKDAIEIISNLAIVNKNSVNILNEHWNTFDSRVTFSLNGTKGISEIYTGGGIVKSLWVCDNLNTTIGDITARIDEPEIIISGGSIAGGRDVILINRTRGVSYFYNTDGLSKEVEFEIMPEVLVECLILFDPTFFIELMDAGMFSMGHYNAEETLRVMYPWSGYGNLDNKYPPRQP